jgi:hypothetical protein
MPSRKALIEKESVDRAEVDAIVAEAESTTASKSPR